MSAAAIADPAEAGGEPPVKRGKKKLIIFIAAGLAAVLLLGGGTVFVLKKRAAAHAAAAADNDVEDVAGAAQAGRIDPKAQPIYLPLDPFVVNLADRESDRYAQIAMTFEVETGAFADQLKTYMPAVRNAVLMILANKTSRDLNDRAGKEQLAQEIMREAVLPMGIEVAMPEPVSVPVVAAAASTVQAAAIAGDGKTPAAAEARPRRPAGVRNPIRRVHYSSFIIQ